MEEPGLPGDRRDRLEEQPNPRCPNGESKHCKNQRTKSQRPRVDLVGAGAFEFPLQTGRGDIQNAHDKQYSTLSSGQRHCDLSQ